MTTPAPPPQSTEPWLRISWAAPNDIRSWSFGRIETKELFDRRLQRFHEGGLYSERIFGPVRDYECACGRTRGLENLYKVCDGCNVSVRPRDVRNQRMGHIELPLPVLHPWFYGSDRAPMELLLGLRARELRGLLRRERFIALDHVGPRLRAALLDEASTYQGRTATGDIYLASSGAGAVRNLLDTVDFVSLYKLLKDYQDHLKFPGETGAAQTTLFNSPDRMPGVVGSERLLDARIEALRRVVHGGLVPRNALLEALPVIPAGLRVSQATRDGRLRIDPVTAAYQRIVRACDRVQQSLDRLADAGPNWPSGELRSRLVRSERRLHRAVSALFDDVLRAGLADQRQRQRPRDRRTFSKRVDFSARAPLAPDAKLPLYACRVPDQAVTDVFAQAFRSGVATEFPWATHRILIEALSHPLIFSVARDRESLEATMFTLHSRPSADACVHVHPAVASAIGRSFADLAASLHLPLSLPATADCDHLSFPWSALRDPATGDRRLSIDADAAIGCYYATWASRDVARHCERLEREFTPWRPNALAFASLDDVYDAWQRGRVSLDEVVLLRLAAGRARVRRFDEDVETSPRPGRTATTAGRAVVNRLLPAEGPFYDLAFDRSALNKTLESILRGHGATTAVQVAERVWALGLQVLTRSGLSCNLAELAPPATWSKRLEQLAERLRRVQWLYDRSIIGYSEQYDSRAREVYEVRQSLIGDKLDVMSSASQLSLLQAVLGGQKALSKDALARLTGIVGTVWRPSGRGLPMPITSCFSRGIGVRGYFQLAEDCRRQLARGAEAARAPRRLARQIMSALADVAITIEDCGSRAGVEIRRKESDESGDLFAKQLRGRVLLNSLPGIGRTSTVVEAGELLSPSLAADIVAEGISRVRVRSPLMCDAPRGVCRRCYGADPATDQLIELGAAAGVKAALAMAPTVHAIHASTATPPQDPLIIEPVQAAAAGVVSLGDLQILTDGERRMVVSTGGVLEIFDENSRPTRQHIPQGAYLHVQTGAQVKQGSAIAVRTQAPRRILAPQAGTIRLERGRGVGRGVILRLIDAGGAIVDASLLPPGSELYVTDGAAVETGDRLAEIPIPYTPRLASLNSRFARLRRMLEVRPRRPQALLAEIDGRVELVPEVDGRRMTILIHPPHGGPAATTHIAWRERRIVIVRSGQAVRVGDALTWGDVFAGDLVRLRGLDEMRPRLWAEMQEQLATLRHDRRPRDERPWELLLGQMLRFAQVQSSGDSRLAVGAVLPRAEVEAINRGLRRMWRISDRRAYPIPLDADVLSPRLYDIAAGRFAALHPGKPLPPARRAWPAGWTARLTGLRELAERGSYLAAGGLKPTRSSLVRAALDGRLEPMSQLQHRILAGQRTKYEPG